ncbi:MAG: zinc ribbon domain-containing protein [Acidobacteria bacterium]|nr:zinc ribbon domain-containing protein [Acidobacteriota bacterium]
MSSETSTDQFQPWQLFTLAGLIGATVVVIVSRGQTPAGIVLLSLTIFTAAVVGVAVWRTLAPLTRKDQASGPQVLGGRPRAALEREKTLVLRAIKELEFDRGMGKLSEKDFAEMSGRLRARAAGLLRQLDAGVGYREQIEKELARRIGERGPVVRTVSGPSGEPDKARPTRTCVSCNTANDLDARFCKHCGASLRATS